MIRKSKPVLVTSPFEMELVFVTEYIETEEGGRGHGRSHFDGKFRTQSDPMYDYQIKVGPMEFEATVLRYDKNLRDRFGHGELRSCGRPTIDGVPVDQDWVYAWMEKHGESPKNPFKAPP